MRRLSSWQRFLPAALILAAAAAFLQARDRNEVLPERQDLSSLPMQIKSWQARDLTLTPGELEVLGPGQFLLRDYASAAAEPPVNLFIAFFPSQRSGDTIHSPKNCIPGSGWAPIQSGRISVPRADGSAISINRYIVAKGTSRDLVFYWYQAHGRVTPSEYWAKIFLVTDAIRLNRTDGALVRVVIPIAGADGEGAALAGGLEFIHQLLPLLDRTIPR
ncbi:MAG: EpsI family protein [Acidobacteriia bacterium]|nr:EpsI family protein [Terriglobia bacterium]